MDEATERGEQKIQSVTEENDRRRKANKKTSDAAHVLQRVVPSPRWRDADLGGMSLAIISNRVAGEEQDEREPDNAAERECKTNEDIGRCALGSCLRVVHGCACYAPNEK